MSLESFRHTDRCKSQQQHKQLEASFQWLVYVYRLSGGKGDRLYSNGRPDR